MGKVQKALMSLGLIVLAALLTTVYFTKTKIVDDLDVADQLRSLGYMQSYETLPEEQGVTIYNSGSSYDGWNLFTSAHEPCAIFTDMKGNSLYKWKYHFYDAWPNATPSKKDTFHQKERWRTFWRRVYLFDNGDLLANFEGNGLIKIDKDSKLIWKNDCGCHHDLEVLENGDIYILDRELNFIPWINEEEPVLEDFILLLDEDGKQKERISILQLIKDSKFTFLDKGLARRGNILHTNTLEVFDGALNYKNSLFKRGNILVSMLRLDSIAIIDMEEKEIVWAAKSDMWHAQHQPTLLNNGNILIFNNKYSENQSSVVEFNPVTMEKIWQYLGDNGHPFYSGIIGSNQRLSNGNTLITESTAGRVFEVTSDGIIVWEFVNPFELHGKIPAIYELIRLNKKEALTKSLGFLNNEN